MKNSISGYGQTGWKKLMAALNLVVLMGGLVNGFGNVKTAEAAAIGEVVINEIAWAGSVNSANDEWIELYNPTAADVSLNGWKLRYNGADLVTFSAGSVISAHGYFLIERSEAATNVVADLVNSMSLVNTGASLELLDASGTSIDLVNSAKAAWFAGSSTTKATMERKDPLVSGDLASNWISSTGSGATASAGGAIIGTPKAVNSGYTGGAVVNTGAVKIVFSSLTPAVGEVVKATVSAENVTDLFDYGMNLTYDPALLELQGVVPGSFLSHSGNVATSFHSGLKAGILGDLLVAEARTTDLKTGESGSGGLFEVNFKVLGKAGSALALNAEATSSFLANPSADMTVTWHNATATVANNTIEPVTALQAAEGAARYQIKLNWTASVSSPEHYRVERKDAHGNWQILAGVTGTEFVDQDGVSNGGKLIPTLVYQYRVTAVKGSVLSSAVEISGSDVRGIRGDNNRSDLVDGRDLERLAKGFALTDLQAGYEALVDTTYDARIDGSDLIDVGASFAQKY